MSNNYGLEHSAIVDDLMKWERSDDLASATKEIHAHNHAIARPLATLAGYAYADNYRDLEKIARKVFDSQAVWVKHFHMRADGMLLESAADLIRIRTAGGHLGILCYRGTRPQDLISILGVLEIDSK
ncbi:MAG: hypothetical protein LC808_38110, partial [Actinobacteria bacterium]|nr:hypothetical protein [Actinomycetota bacterium]